MKNFALTHVDCTAARTELHELLHLTGCEASLNNLPAGVSIPFVHAHTKNEELYVILAGNGTFFVDGEEFAVKAGDAIRVDPNGQRCVIFASKRRRVASKALRWATRKWQMTLLSPRG